MSASDILSFGQIILPNPPLFSSPPDRRGGEVHARLDGVKKKPTIYGILVVDPDQGLRAGLLERLFHRLLLKSGMTIVRIV